MSFRSVSRVKPMAPEPFCATPADCVRLAAHRAPGGRGSITIIWIGSNIAAKLGLSERRHVVDLMIDDEAEHLRLAITKRDGADFCATRRGRSHCVYLDAQTSGQFFRMSFGSETIKPDAVTINGHVSFTVPDRWRA